MALTFSTVYKLINPPKNEKTSSPFLWGTVYVFENSLLVGIVAFGVISLMTHGGVPLGPLNVLIVVPLPVLIVITGGGVVIFALENSLGASTLLKHFFKSQKLDHQRFHFSDEDEERLKRAREERERFRSTATQIETPPLTESTTAIKIQQAELPSNENLKEDSSTQNTEPQVSPVAKPIFRRPKEEYIDPPNYTEDQKKTIAERTHSQIEAKGNFGAKYSREIYARTAIQLAHAEGYVEAIFEHTKDEATHCEFLNMFVLEKGKEVRVGTIEFERIDTQRNENFIYSKYGHVFEIGKNEPQVNKVYIYRINNFDKNELYKGVGTRLMQLAFEISMMDSSEGRLMLEATNSHGFFWKMGFHCIDPNGYYTPEETEALGEKVTDAPKKNGNPLQFKYINKSIYMCLPEESISKWKEKVATDPILKEKQ